MAADPNREGLEELLAAYALNALSDVERVHAERAIDSDPAAAELFAELSAAVAGLATRVPQVSPPAGLRGRVLDAADRLMPRKRRRLPVPGAWAAAAVLLLAVIGLGSFSAAQQNQVQSLRAEVDLMQAEMSTAEARLQEQRDLARWVAQPGATTAAVEPVESAPQMSESMGVLVRRARGGPVLFAMNMPDLDGRSVYQVWLWYDGEPMSVGTFVVDRDGYALVHLDEDAGMDGAQLLSVEVAPDGGGQAPLGSPVMAASLR